ncbi:unnamed protein product, partial [Ectocarpus fasciculatus]
GGGAGAARERASAAVHAGAVRADEDSPCAVRPVGQGCQAGGGRQGPQGRPEGSPAEPHHPRELRDRRGEADAVSGS